MANNFRVDVIGGDMKRLNLKILGDFDGTFGICEMCGAPIAVKRLKARPVTAHCIDCKRVRETFERLTGDEDGYCRFPYPNPTAGHPIPSDIRSRFNGLQAGR